MADLQVPEVKRVFGSMPSFPETIESREGSEDIDIEVFSSLSISFPLSRTSLSLNSVKI